MKCILLINLLFLNTAFAADIIPTQIADADSDKVVDSFSSVYSGALAKPSYALGTKASFSLSTSLVDLSDFSDLGNQIDDDMLLVNHISVSKGLYQNFDLGFSALAPVESNKTISGYGGYINWLKEMKGFNFKPGIYLSNLNIDNVYNSFSAGLSLSVFTHALFFKAGFHYIIESHEVDVKAQKAGVNIFVSGQALEKEGLYHSVALSMAYETRNFDLIIQPTYIIGTNFLLSAKLVLNI